MISVVQAQFRKVKIYQRAWTNQPSSRATTFVRSGLTVLLSQTFTASTHCHLNIEHILIYSMKPLGPGERALVGQMC
jgi:hypothetical protein